MKEIQKMLVMFSFLIQALATERCIYLGDLFSWTVTVCAFLLVYAVIKSVFL